MTRIKAFLTHLGISSLLFLIILYFIVFHWYPGFLFTADGGWQGVRIVAGVDLVLGPLLTLIVFKPGKPSLKFDMTVIALLQASALAWGVWVTHYERPYAVMYYENNFAPITRHELEEEGIPIDKVDRIGNHESPRMIYVDLPLEDFEKMREIRIKARQRPLYLWHERYASFKPEYLPTMRIENIDLEFILQRAEKLDNNIKEEMTSYAAKQEDYLFLLMNTRIRKMIAVFDTRSLKIVDTIDFNPIKYIDIIRKPKTLPGK